MNYEAEYYDLKARLELKDREIAELNKKLRYFVREYLDFVEYERGDVAPLNDDQFERAFHNMLELYENDLKNI